MPTRHLEAGGADLGVAVAPKGLGGGKILPVPAGSQSICDCRNPRQREHVRAPVFLDAGSGELKCPYSLLFIST